MNHDWQKNISLAQHTTLGIGGPAEYFCEVRSTDDLLEQVKRAKRANLSVTVLGEGSNVLIADSGIRGLVIKNISSRIEISGEAAGSVSEEPTNPVARLESDKKNGTFRGIEFKDLDYDESDRPCVKVMMDSGVKLARAMKYLFDKGITGLQWYARIPGTIGGAVVNNIHGGTHFLSEVLETVDVLTPSLERNTLVVSDLGVDYDLSRFHDSGEIVLRATFKLFKGDVEKARFVANEWKKRKLIQPGNSPGCAFANITQEQKIKNNYPTTSVGYIIEHVLNMTGFKVGGAAIYPEHHNFIVNTGGATANDYLAVLKEIYQRTKEKTGISLIPEIFLLGFRPEEIKEFYRLR